MKLIKIGVAFCILAALSGCATTTQPQEPQVKRISQEELDKIMPKPVPNLTLDEIVMMSKQGQTPEQIIQKIKETNSRYDLTPTQVVDLSKQGVSAKVLDFIHERHEAAVRDNFADEINKREKLKQQQEDQLRREYQLRTRPYYDPFFGYYGSPYYRYYPYRPGMGFGMRFGW